MNNLFKIIIILILLLPTVYAKSDEVMIQVLSDKVYKECKDQIIILPSSCFTLNNFATCRDVFQPNELNKTSLKLLFDVARQAEPYAVHTPSCRVHPSFTTPGIDGCSLLICGDNILDVNGDKYYWNGIEITKPTKIYQFFFSIFSFEVCMISFTVISIGILLAVIFARKRRK